MCLTELHVGRRARLRNMRRLHRHIRRRLAEMGFYEGVEVTLSHRFPFGGPIVMESKYGSVGIRKEDARLVEVEIL